MQDRSLEQRVRRAAARQQLTLIKSRTPLPCGDWLIADDRNVLVAGDNGMSLAEVEQYVGDAIG